MPANELDAKYIGTGDEFPRGAELEDLVALDAGLQALEKIDPRKCKADRTSLFRRVVYGRDRAGSGHLPVTVRRDLRMAEAWLNNEM